VHTQYRAAAPLIFYQAESATQHLRDRRPSTAPALPTAAVNVSDTASPAQNRIICACSQQTVPLAIIASKAFGDKWVTWQRDLTKLSSTNSFTFTGTKHRTSTCAIRTS